MLRATECLRTDILGLRPTAGRTLSVFSGIHTLLTLLRVFFFSCLRSRGSKLLYPVLDYVAVGNPSGSLC